MNNLPVASAYVYQGRLCILGICESGLGPVPFAVSEGVEGVDDGPVDIGTELAEPLSKAMQKCQEQVQASVNVGKQKLAVESLVTRSRQGDQNAMAILVGIGENARKGVKRAQQSFKIARSFIHRNPVEARTSFGIESKLLARASDPYAQSAAIVVLTPYVDMERMIVLLCDGPPVPTRLSALAKAIPKDERPAFNLGFKHSRNKRALDRALERLEPQFYRAFQVGYAAGVANRFQNALKEEGRISDICPLAGWEHGE